MSEFTETIGQILSLYDKAEQIYNLIETKINQVNDVKARKKIRDAVKNRDRDALNKLLFD